jgi:hypothetical protein
MYRDYAELNLFVIYCGLLIFLLLFWPITKLYLPGLYASLNHGILVWPGGGGWWYSFNSCVIRLHWSDCDNGEIERILDAADKAG